MAKRSAKAVDNCMDSGGDVVEGAAVDEIREADLDNALQDFAERYDFPDLRKMSQNQWHGAMTHVYLLNFKGTRKLICDPYVPVKNSSNNIYTSYNHYNTDKLYILVKWYIYKSDLYDKAATIRGYINLTGIEYNTLWEWLKSEDGKVPGKGLSVPRNEIIKLLRAAEEDSLTAIGITGKRIPTGTLEALNYRYGHNMPGVTREVSDTRRTPDEIAAAHGVQIGSKQTDRALPAASFVDVAQQENGAK